VSASLPTLSAVPNPQLWYTASAGWPDSTQLARLRRRGIKAAKNPGGPEALTWLEWSLDVCDEYCEADCDQHDNPDDETTWGKANPGLGIRISLDHVRREYEAMSDGRGHAGTGFLRERCGVGEWPLDDESWAVIKEADWDACADLEYPRPSRFCFCADSTPDQSAATIAVAGMLRDGRACVEIPQDDSGVLDHRAGTGWVVGRLKELKLKYRTSAIVIDKFAASGALLDAAEKAGLDVISPNVNEIAGGFGLFYQLVTDKQLAHRDQPGLKSALAGAARRDIGDGGHAWARKDSAVDISPLCAATMAVWAANKFARPYDLLKSIA
jgi:phage terminase large subunit-like protein